MVWFSCEDCGDSLKKPKLQAHMSHCSASRLTCLDCNRTFDRQGAKEHNTCVTEHQKYAEGATKPGGALANGVHHTANTGKANQIATGLQFLATSSPWVCRLCNVTCTSQDTLNGHAAGAKHIRRVKAATANIAPEKNTGADTQPQVSPENELAQAEQPVKKRKTHEGRSDEMQEGIANTGRKAKIQKTKAEKVSLRESKDDTESKKEGKGHNINAREGQKASKRTVQSSTADTIEGRSPAQGNTGISDDSKLSKKAYKTIDWVKLAKKELKSTGKTSCKQLRKVLRKRGGVRKTKSANQYILDSLLGSALFVIQGDTVNLA